MAEYRVRKYNKNRCKLKTYDTPSDDRVVFKKEDTVPLLIRVCSFFLTLGGLISFFLGSSIIGAKQFFRFKKKVEDISDNFSDKKVVEIRVKE